MDAKQIDREIREMRQLTEQAKREYRERGPMTRKDIEEAIEEGEGILFDITRGPDGKPVSIRPYTDEEVSKAIGIPYDPNSYEVMPADCATRGYDYWLECQQQAFERNRRRKLSQN